MKIATIQLETLTCPSCIQKIEAALKKVAGVDQKSVTVGFNASRVTLTFSEALTSIESLVTVISKLGYEVKTSNVT